MANSARYDPKVKWKMTVKENAKRRKRKMLRIATRLGRRPLKVLKNYAELGVVKQVRGLKNKDIVQLVRGIETSFREDRHIAPGGSRLIFRDVPNIAAGSLSSASKMITSQNCP